MKVRTGFVSNSSASSFLIMVKKERWEKIEPTLHPFEQHVAEVLNEAFLYADYQEFNLFGQDVVCFATMEDGGYSWGEMVMDHYYDYDGDLPEGSRDESDALYTALNTIVKKLEEYPEDVAKIRMGWG